MSLERYERDELTPTQRQLIDLFIDRFDDDDFTDTAAAGEVGCTPSYANTVHRDFEEVIEKRAELQVAADGSGNEELVRFELTVDEAWTAIRSTPRSVSQAIYHQIR